MPGGHPDNESYKSVRNSVQKAFGPMKKGTQTKFENKLAAAKDRNKARNRAHLETKRSTDRAKSQGMVITRRTA